ncbi:rubrerythrin family protein [Sesbania bispinosa]|nr:rubrerythrin family protein [Sesbania bispinosa]
MSRRLKLWRRSRDTQSLTGTRLADAVAAGPAKVELRSPLVQVAGHVVASLSQIVTDEQRRGANPAQIVTDEQRSASRKVVAPAMEAATNEGGKVRESSSAQG